MLFIDTSCLVYLQIYETVELVTGVQMQHASFAHNQQGIFSIELKTPKGYTKAKFLSRTKVTILPLTQHG